jgi:iron complex outermembrane receptor protein
LLTANGQQLFGRAFEFTDESLRAVLDLDYVFDNGISLGSLTALQDIEEHNDLDADIFGFQSTSNVDIITQEFNLVSPDDQRLQWVTGVYFEKQSAEFPPWGEGGFNFYIDDQFPLVTSFWDKEDTYSSVFAHFSYDLTDSLEIEAGARYTHFTTEQTTEWLLNLDTSMPPDINNPDTVPFQQASVGGDFQELSEGSLDGQIALHYAVSDEHFVYGLISRGHITSGINIFPGDPPNPPFLQYDEMQVINFEGGWKARWMDDQLRTQFSIFYQDITDYQANFAQVGGVINNPTNRNATDGSEVSGVELSAQAALGNWDIDFGFGYLDGKLGTFEDVQNPLDGSLVDLSGASSPFSPEVSTNIGFGYTFAMNGYRLMPRVDVAYQSETQAALFQNPEFTLDARTLINTQVALVPESGAWALTFWMNNATDERYIGGIQNNASLYYAGMPRTYGLRLHYNFGS